MGAPIRRSNGKWQIRWVERDGRRRGVTLTSNSTAVCELRKQELRVEQERLGIAAKPVGGHYPDRRLTYHKLRRVVKRSERATLARIYHHQPWRGAGAAAKAIPEKKKFLLNGLINVGCMEDPCD